MFPYKLETGAFKGILFTYVSGVFQEPGDIQVPGDRT